MYQVLLSSVIYTINQLKTKISLKIICCMPEAISCCLQTCNVAASEEIVGERCVPSLIITNSTINLLESLITTQAICCCLQG